LLGRRTYEDLLAYWNTQESPFKDALDNAQKHVASTTLREPLAWPNTTVLEGEVTAAVNELRRHPGKGVHVLGSGELMQTLGASLIDELLLLVYPLVLGSGQRLFRDGSVTTTTGVVIATYGPGE